MHQFQTRFNVLHQRRAEAIAAIYAQLIETHRVVRGIVLPIPMPGDHYQHIARATVALQAFSAAIEKNRLYLDASLEEDLAAISASLWAAVQGYGYGNNLAHNEGSR